MVFKRLQRTRKPTAPGEILQEEFLSPLGLSQEDLASHLGWSPDEVARLVGGMTAVTARQALHLAAAFETSPEFWLNAQKAVDLYEASQQMESLPAPLPRAS